MSDIDFSAWDVPPPPEGLADAVVARMAEPAPVPEPAPRRRRWVIAASAAGVLAIAAGVWAIVRSREPALPNASDHGEVLADRAQHVELGGISADLDRGADIRWHRTSHGLEVEQRAGAASWHISRDERMTIGATVASIDAAGASLRVEVPMNLSDTRLIGASAATAAAVAMVTVVVYEGHVKVASSGQTVVVQPGTTYTVNPAPVVGATVDRRPTVAVLGFEGGPGAELVASQLSDQLREWVKSEVFRTRTGLPRFELAPNADKMLVDEKLLHDCESEAPACMSAIAHDLGVDELVYGHVTSNRDGYVVTAKRLIAKDASVSATERRGPPSAVDGVGFSSMIASSLFDEQKLPDVPDEAAVQQIVAGSSDELRACNSGGSMLGVSITPFGKVSTVTIDGNVAPPCISDVMNHLAFPTSKHGGTFTRRLAKGGCDADALIEEGNGYLGTRGDALKALAKYEAAIACKPEARTERLAFMAACNAKNVTKAREHWDKLDERSQTQVLQICVRNGIGKDQLDTSCDADDVQNKGMSQEQVGQHAAALSSFEAAMHCKNANVTRLSQLAFMTACNAKIVSKAQQYWRSIPAASAQQLKQMCIRNGISEDMLDGGQATSPPPDGQGRLRIDGVPPAQILVDGRAIGNTPVLLTIAPGKHKVTYVVDGDRFTYNVTVKAGETETLSKDLR